MSATTGNLLLAIRADASPEIGGGHATRCLALAQACLDLGGDAVFLCAEKDVDSMRRVIGQEVPLESLTISETGGEEDARATLEVLDRVGPDWVVVDGYDFSSSYLCSLSDAFPTLLFDDYLHRESYPVTALVNYSPGAEGLDYRSKSTAHVLLGPKFAPLRRMFRERSISQREVTPTCERLLVTIGSSDFINVTGRVIEALSSIPHSVMTTVVVGPMNQDVDAIEGGASRAGGSVVVLQDPPDLLQLMSEADVAVSGGGSTLFELAALGVPSVAIIIAENQEQIVRQFSALGVTLDVGWAADMDPRRLGANILQLMEDFSTRVRMARRGSEMVDGLGANRLVQALLRIQEDGSAG